MTLPANNLQKLSQVEAFVDQNKPVGVSQDGKRFLITSGIPSLDARITPAAALLGRIDNLKTAQTRIKQMMDNPRFATTAQEKRDKVTQLKDKCESYLKMSRTLRAFHENPSGSPRFQASYNLTINGWPATVTVEWVELE